VTNETRILAGYRLQRAEEALKEKADYADLVAFEEKDVAPWLPQAREFVSAAKLEAERRMND